MVKAFLPKKPKNMFSKISKSSKVAGNLKPASLKEVPLQTPNNNDYKQGIKLYYSAIQKPIRVLADTAGGAVGAHFGGMTGAGAGAVLSDKYVTPILEKILKRPLIGVSKLAAPTFDVRFRERSDFRVYMDALNYAGKVSKGGQDDALNSGVEGLFRDLAHYKASMQRFRTRIDKRSRISYARRWGAWTNNSKISSSPAS